MIKYKIFATFLILITLTLTQAYSQCSGHFNSQSEIDSFIIKFPLCDTLNTLFLSSNSNNDPIKNLDGLRNIRYINSEVNLFYLESLSDVSGLDNVEEINGDLGFRSLPLIKNFDGFKGLIKINGNLIIELTNFDSITGFGALRKIDNVLSVSYNPSLKNVHHLGELDSIYRIVIYDNAKLESINFLNSVTTITEQITINSNDSLINLNGFENLKSAEQLIIDNNQSLNSISALTSFKKLGSTSNSLLRIKKNPKLSTLIGLENLDISTVSEMIITENELLSYCHLDNICEFVSSSFNDATIIGNDTDCDTKVNLVNMCSSSFNLSEGIIDQCVQISNLNISESNLNNNELLHIYDEFNNILCSINAKGNDLGTTEFKLFNSSELRIANIPYANRDFTITPENQPSSNVLVRLYYTDEDISSIIQNDDSVNSFKDIVISKVQSDCTGSISETNKSITPFSQSRIDDNTYFMDINVQEFSTFFAHGTNEILLNTTNNLLKDLVIYPNPVNNYLFIPGIENCKLELFNIYGDNLEIDIESTNKNQLNVSYLSPGLYILNIKAGSIKESVKFIKI